MPQGAHPVGHGLASDRAALFGGPEHEARRGEHLGEQEAFRFACEAIGGLDIGVAPGGEVGGKGGRQGDTLRDFNGFNRVTLRGGTAELFIPIQ